MVKLQYNVSVKRSIYAAYYFRLRDVSERQYNLHYRKLMLSMSQRDFLIPMNDSCVSNVSRGSSNSAGASHHNGSSRAGSSTGLMGMGMAGSGNGSVSSGNGNMTTSTHHSRVPVGPGYRKWTLKPLSVREADRLEARSAVYCSNMMMEEQERRDAGCCLDEYSSASPEELHNLSATLLAAASMHTIASAAGASNSGRESLSSGSSTAAGSQHMSTSTSTASSVATMASSSLLDLATKDQETNSISPVEGTNTTEPLRRTLCLKKSRSDFFFQNTTPASIM
ncbi:hypothetical protein BGX33_001052 [Mortierella sp. NVP41]|nr:hypothetical protein BGX33_001052 [Mortierella sp. NVP41]